MSKRLDYMAAGWPSCLRAIAATAILVKEASKLTLGQDLQIIAPHALEALLRRPRRAGCPIPELLSTKCFS